MIYATRRERIEAEKLQLRGRRMRSLKVGVASFATFAGVTVAGIAPAHADHTVESGDTLSDIAAKHDGVTVSSLMEANGLSSHIIYPGQNLSFSGDSSSSSDSSSTTTSTSSSSSTHTVASGDTLGSIAAQHGVSVSALKSENGLSSHLIYPGDQLTIPGGSSSASSNTGSVSSSSNNTSSTSSNSSNNTSSTSTESSTSSSNSSSSTDIDSSNSERVSSTSTASTSSTSGVSWAVSTANSSSASYRLGANGEGNQWDCSSFTQQALSQDGKSIPRSSSAQYASAQKISKGQLQAGDLVFYGNGGVSHVAIYVGNGQIAHARNPSAGLSTSDLNTYNQYNNVVGYGRY
ncbi:MAG TPA: LysM peptidoglycan-binding domain-containing protein [Candidatus Yaniella excrementigallinarum]|nr:LysM peptidoglycan-binding domain-containing protein [Candidatus Yaniella excrementigallinarum]